MRLSAYALPIPARLPAWQTALLLLKCSFVQIHYGGSKTSVLHFQPKPSHFQPKISPAFILPAAQLLYCTLGATLFFAEFD